MKQHFAFALDMAVKLLIISTAKRQDEDYDEQVEETLQDEVLFIYI